MTTKAGRNIKAIDVGNPVDDAVVIGCHFIEATPAENQLEIAEFRQSMNERRHEIMMKSVEIATESETGWLIRIGLRNNDLIVWRTAPVNSAWIDHYREFVRPRPRQRASK